MSLARLIARRVLLVGGAAGAAGVATVYSSDYTQLKFDAFSAVNPFVHLLDAETAHNFAISCAKRGLVPRDRRPDPPSLHTAVWGRHFTNPIGLAAGFDKNGEVVEGMLGVGFGFVEIGSVTPLPQPGTAPPRVFRLPDLKAVINRYGFNSKGVDAVAACLSEWRACRAQRPDAPPGLLGVNLGKNKLSADAALDYCTGVARLGEFADYLVINVSSPNTPGLRALQSRRTLEGLVRRVKAARDATHWGPRGPPPLLVKIAPDLTSADKRDIAAVALKLGIDGLIVSNTTIAREGLVEAHPCGHEAGGLSGAPLFEKSTQVLRDMYELTGGKLPIIGCGGIFSGEDAYRKIRAGASLVQLYTSLAYEGPAIVPRIKRELAQCLAADGFECVADAVGVDHRPTKK